jgi:ATP-binding cassette, subfamily B, bacterial PglK
MSLAKKQAHKKLKSITKIYLFSCSLYRRLNKSLRKRFILVLVLMSVVSLFEILSIGSVIPFLAALTDIESLYSIRGFDFFVNTLGISKDNLSILLAVMFIFAALLSGLLRLVLLKATINLAFTIGSFFSNQMYAKTICQPYSVQINRNSSEIVDAITNKSTKSVGAVLAILSLLNSCILLTILFFLMFAIDWVAAMLTFIVCFIIYFLTIIYGQNKVSDRGRLIAFQTSNLVKIVQESLGGIRDIILDKSHSVYEKIFKNADDSLRIAQGDSQFIANYPRYLIETIGIISIALLSLLMSSTSGGLITAIPLLGLLALCTQRFLPVLQQGYMSFVNLLSWQKSISDVFILLDQSAPSLKDDDVFRTRVVFDSCLCMKAISFSYSESLPQVIRDLDFSLYKGDYLGIVGESGVGKSTFLDLMMGLLQPCSGYLEVDGEEIMPGNMSAYQRIISHVPQMVFFSSGTIRENIIFGCTKRDGLLNVDDVIEIVGLTDFVSRLPDGVNTLVGERGAFLSGGQRQRIGIARALYREGDIIILDEATSALDRQSEADLMRNIAQHTKLGRTIVSISHNLDSLRGCNRIIQLLDGSIREYPGYEDYISNVENFKS